ncbi:PREDICTED: WW domain-binding protein 4 isoform X2 [Dinoponera quadriceps]|uniref:WW domain-binding protein 4 isoform X2 n=1 Tax=Dinoponera quadriceps TaxID=609295 RepID=A0A6P3XWA0_DINQU|nr:PREDICTED: WW domain-binding protein 4 isoform X2 [Dinoponera quadriceps]XP_014482815.1 PREDICTED: WW domain-binding protein 4 isoform X2 [Dinoponera quadriceps]XP_014482816.1 PREDICTED: WW domain-binding protein 4 isoform X2 [Dinoponera quadriceps]XP_014482817.1 PREDICTED: WW domain-binding protein 4 isoform X2 [Dinoponera quadriceps]XP_014482818.1 PREDICTED: WW domain-binding protein 4 isoform X2 [Dinoponera quadriceps]
MTDYWKSQNRKFCDFCKCWIADNKPSIDFHEGGRKHKENVSKRLKEIHKNSAKQAKQNKKFEDDIKKMENAAMAAYLKDVENNTRDMTAERIIKEKLNKVETKEGTPQKSCMSSAAPETVARFKSKPEQFFPIATDPCDPATLSKNTPSVPRVQQGGENRTPGKSKASKMKGKGKKSHEDDRPSAPVRKLWYEALSPEGYTYYWHIETNESVWEPPEEGYMTFAEQEEEAKEEAFQKELMEQLDKEEAIKKADIIEEQRANVEREKMREFRRRSTQATAENDDAESDDKNAGEVKREAAEEERPYRRDYSVPDRPQPYGSWQIVQTIEKKPVDLQLPKQKQIQLPTFEKIELPPLQRTFKERTVTKIAGDSDDEGTSVTFKKRKIGNKNVRKRATDD